MTDEWGSGVRVRTSRRARCSNLARFAGLVLLGGCATLSPAGRPSQGELAIAEADARAMLAAERSIASTSLPPRTVAVVPFAFKATDGDLAPLSYGLADLLATDLARSAQVTVVNRLHIGALLRELDLVAAGRVDSSAAPRVGRLLGARRLIGGEVLGQGASRLTLQPIITDASTASWQLGQPATADVDLILDGVKTLALSIFADLGVNLTPAEAAAIEQRPTRHLGALLAYSRAVQNEEVGDFAAAETNYRAASQLDPQFLLAGTRLTQAASHREESARISERRKQERGGAARAMSLANGALNPSSFPAVADAVDPSFTRSRVKLPVIVIVNIP